MTRYQPYGPRDTVPPPYYSSGGRFLALVLAGEQAKIDNLVETMLNEPAEGAVAYKAVGHWIVMLVGSYNELGSRALGYDGHGVAPETQVSFFVPLLGKRRGQLMPYPCLTAPFIYVDNPMSLLTGREVFGYPKGLGVFTPPIWTGTEIQMTAFGGRYLLGAHAAWTQLLAVESNAVTAPPPSSFLSPASIAPSEDEPMTIALELMRRAEITVEGMPAEEGGVPTALGNVETFVRMLQGTIRQAFLKQFRDERTALDACYRIVIEADGSMKNVRQSLSPHEWTVTLGHLDNHPIAAELGLPPSASTNLAWEMSMDIELQPGRQVAP